MGAYLSLPTWWRNLDARYRLVVGRCRSCDGYTFPAEGACVECNAIDSLEPIEPEGYGTVVAHTVIENGAPPEFSDLLTAEGAIGVVLIQLDEGVRVPGMLTDCDPHAVHRDDRVKAVVRRIYKQEGIIRYGTKFQPIDK